MFGMRTVIGSSGKGDLRPAPKTKQGGTPARPVNDTTPEFICKIKPHSDIY